jgi:hypothetical protein
MFTVKICFVERQKVSPEEGGEGAFRLFCFFFYNSAEMTCMINGNYESIMWREGKCTIHSREYGLLKFECKA